MRRGAISGVTVAVLLIAGLTQAFSTQFTGFKTIVVPDDYREIQKAINAAGSGDTVYVKRGRYCENLVVNKSISLIGEGKDVTVIDGMGSGDVVRVTASNVVIANFTIQNSGIARVYDSGVLLFRVTNVTVRNNVICRNAVGVLFLDGTSGSAILDNVITHNFGYGIYLTKGSGFNVFVGNTLENNQIGVSVSSSQNRFYRNNFVKNGKQAFIAGYPNWWDNGVEGNYWSDYVGEDLDGDGVGDTDTPIWADLKPLVEPWSLRRVYRVNAFNVVMESNFTIASFRFNYALKKISFRITGPREWYGYCNVIIPKALMHATPLGWLIRLGETDVTGSSRISENETHTFVHLMGEIAGNTVYVTAKQQVRTRIQLIGPSEVKVNVPIVLLVKLKDEFGNPLQGKSVSVLYLERSEVAETNASGYAIIVALLAVAGEVEFRAEFKGDADYIGSSSTLTISVLDEPAVTNQAIYIVAIVSTLTAVALIVKAIAKKRPLSMLKRAKR